MGTVQMTTNINNRSCGDCTACCEGWHTSNIRGHEMYPGRPCHFFGKSCTIYEFRPESCKSYQCAWLDDDRSAFPEWLRPDISGVICDWRPWSGGSYLEVREMGKQIDSKVLSWLYEFGASRNLSMRVQVNGHWHNHGSEEFMREF